jgi:exodeoxyribonuclease VII small subunit
MEAGRKKLTFEEAVKRLEEIVVEMEKEDMPLEKSIKLFQEGMELAGICNLKLDEAERKISIVMKNTQGMITEEEFNPGEE